MSDEHLWREMKEQEMADDARYRQNLAPQQIGKLKEKPIDYNAAMKRFEQDFKPVFERRERARTSKAYRLFLKATGQWTDMDAAEAINPTKGLVPDGLTPEQLAKEIQQNPEAYKHLAKAAPRVTPVTAEHRTITPKWDKDEGK
jgi:hypothetical protein